MTYMLNVMSDLDTSGLEALVTESTEKSTLLEISRLSNMGKTGTSLVQTVRVKGFSI